jgi:hypothetical protein
MFLVLTRLVAALAALGVATAVMTAGTAAADPTPSPSPPQYQVPTPGGGVVLPDVQTYQPVCRVAPLACAMRYDPATGTWQPVGQ